MKYTFAIAIACIGALFIIMIGLVSDLTRSTNGPLPAAHATPSTAHLICPQPSPSPGSNSMFIRKCTSKGPVFGDITAHSTMVHCPPDAECCSGTATCSDYMILMTPDPHFTPQTTLTINEGDCTGKHSIETITSIGGPVVEIHLDCRAKTVIVDVRGGWYVVIGNELK